MTNDENDVWDLEEFGALVTADEMEHRNKVALHLALAWDRIRNEAKGRKAAAALVNRTCYHLVEAFCDVARVGRKRGLAMMEALAQQNRATVGGV